MVNPLPIAFVPAPLGFHGEAGEVFVRVEPSETLASFNREMESEVGIGEDVVFILFVPLLLLGVGPIGAVGEIAPDVGCCNKGNGSIDPGCTDKRRSLVGLAVEPSPSGVPREPILRCLEIVGPSAITIAKLVVREHEGAWRSVKESGLDEIEPIVVRPEGLWFGVLALDNALTALDASVGISATGHWRVDFADLDAFSLIVFTVGVSVRAVAFFGKAHPTDENPRARAVVAGVVTEDVSMTGLEGAVAQGVRDVVELLVDQHELAEPRSKPIVTFLGAVGPVESGLAVRA